MSIEWSVLDCVNPPFFRCMKFTILITHSHHITDWLRDSSSIEHGSFWMRHAQRYFHKSSKLPKEHCTPIKQLCLFSSFSMILFVCKHFKIFLTQHNNCNSPRPHRSRKQSSEKNRFRMDPPEHFNLPVSRIIATLQRGLWSQTDTSKSTRFPLELLYDWLVCKHLKIFLSSYTRVTS